VVIVWLFVFGVVVGGGGGWGLRLGKVAGADAQIKRSARRQSTRGHTINNNRYAPLLPLLHDPLLGQELRRHRVDLCVGGERNEREV
jgi:hypothetical protein